MKPNCNFAPILTVFPSPANVKILDVAGMDLDVEIGCDVCSEIVEEPVIEVLVTVLNELDNTVLELENVVEFKEGNDDTEDNVANDGIKEVVTNGAIDESDERTDKGGTDKEEIDEAEANEYGIDADGIDEGGIDEGGIDEV
jgi:hypothetical protein